VSAAVVLATSDGTKSERRRSAGMEPTYRWRASGAIAGLAATLSGG
jgi:hypothetical protein